MVKDVKEGGLFVLQAAGLIIQRNASMMATLATLAVEVVKDARDPGDNGGGFVSRSAKLMNLVLSVSIAVN